MAERHQKHSNRIQGASKVQRLKRKSLSGIHPPQTNVRITREAGKWLVISLMNTCRAEDVWAVVGACSSRRVAVRLWLALMSMERR